MKNQITYLILFWMTFFVAHAQPSDQLSGSIIRYHTNKTSSKNVFDNNPSTYMEAVIPTGSWVGLDLGSPHVITQIEFIAGTRNMQTGIFEASNDPDFKQAVPLYLIPEKTTNKTTYKIPVSVSKGFRYVRYFGATNSYCIINELKLFGYAGQGNDSKYFQVTNLPTVVINTDTKADITTKEFYQQGNIRFVSADGSMVYTDSLRIRGRGNASWTHPKKGFRLKLAHATNVLGAPAKAKDWTLIAAYNDKSLIRPKIGFDLSRTMNFHYTPHVQHVDLIVNGNYRGTYMLCDQIEKNKDRVNIKNDGETDSDYLIEIDAYAYNDPTVNSNSVFKTSKTIPVTIKYPKDDKITSEQKEFLRGSFNDFETALFSSYYTDPTNGYRKYIDIKSFIDYFLLEEFLGNPDAFWSTYMIKKKGDNRFYTGPIWDLDLSMDLDSRIAPISANNNFISLTTASSAGTPSPIAGYFNLNDPNAYKNNFKELLLRLKTDPAFNKDLTTAWKNLRDQNDFFNNKSLLSRITALKKELQPSQKLDVIRWPDGAIPKGSYDAEVDFVLNYLYDRINWMDQILGYTPSNSEDDFLSQPVALSGWNSDIVVENLPIDNHISRAFSADLLVCYTSAIGINPAHALPDNRILHSLKSKNTYYKLAPYNEKQTAYIKGGSTVKLDFVDPFRNEGIKTIKGLSILGSSANGNGNLDVTITYTDGTTQLSHIVIDDWWPSTQKPAVADLGQIQAYNAGNKRQTTFRLYESRIMTDEAKIIESVSFKNKSNSRPFIFAISELYQNAAQQRNALTEKSMPFDSETVSETPVYLWPNPISQGEVVYIEAHNITTVHLLSLQTGHLIKTVTPVNNRITIPMNVEKGVYVAQIIFANSNSPSLNKKIIVK